MITKLVVWCPALAFTGVQVTRNELEELRDLRMNLTRLLARVSRLKQVRRLGRHVYGLASYNSCLGMLAYAAFVAA